MGMPKMKKPQSKSKCKGMKSSHILYIGEETVEQKKIM